MHAYTLDQWILFFFFYCFCGWLWECCYVSVRKGRWVNRGFLHGPLLPIYGSGALIILLATISVRESLPLVFLLGMVAATALEYCTGAAMESLFKVRYWDYSDQPLNLHGYICLFCSLGWGGFSVLLVRFLHPPVQRLIVSIPAFLAEPLAFALVAGITVDTVQSFHAAMDLRQLLTRLTEENEELRRLARRAEILSAFAEEDLQKFREKTELGRLLLAQKLEDELAERHEAQTRRRLRRTQQLEKDLARRTAAKLQALHNIAQALEDHLQALSQSTDPGDQEVLAQRSAEIAQALDRLKAQEHRVRERSAKSYQKTMRILRGNPTASARHYAEAMEALRRLGGFKKDGQ